MNDVFTWPVGRARQLHGVASVPSAPLLPVLTYLVATTTGGTAVAVALGLTSWAVEDGLGLPERALPVAGAPLVLVAAVSQLLGRVDPLPERRRQVPTRWLQWRHRWATAIGFGVVIGSGAFTYLRHAAAWVFAIVLLAAPSIVAAAVCGAVYGCARGAPLLVTWVIDQGTTPRPRWERLGGTRAPVTLALAPLAISTYAAVLVVQGP